MKVSTLYSRVPLFDCLCPIFSGGGSEVVDEFDLKLRARLRVPPSILLGVLRSCSWVADCPTARMVTLLQNLARPLVPCFIAGSPKFLVMTDL